MQTIDNFNFAGKKAIVRVDFNVPLDENGKITDDTRIRGALPTLKKVLADGGSLIIMSHMGKPKGKVNAKFSLSQITDAVSEKLGVPVQFAPDCAKASDAAAALKAGEVLLLENLRFYPEEEGKPVGIDKEDPAYEDAKKAMKASQKEFAKTLASYADCYINDAFGTAHRKHASTAVIADYFDADHKMLGYLMEKEVKAVDNILKDIKRPFTAIMGGSKVSTKIGIIENLMDKVDNLILCGGMTYTFAKAQGGKIGNSIVEDDKLELALDIIAKAKANKAPLEPLKRASTTTIAHKTKFFLIWALLRKAVINNIHPNCAHDIPNVFVFTLFAIVNLPSIKDPFINTLKRYPTTIILAILGNNSQTTDIFNLIKLPTTTDNNSKYNNLNSPLK